MTSARCTDTEGSAAIYREAARRLAAKEPVTKFKSCCDHCLNSCCMINSVGMDAGVDDDALLDAYRELFAPQEDTGPCAFWGAEWGVDAKRCRILALCFMAAMVESGDA